MRQRFSVSPLLISVFSLLMDAIITIAAAAESCPAGQAIGRLVSVQGAVELNRAVAAPEALICAGDVVYVAARSRAAILLLNTETILRLDQESELRLQPPPQPRRSMLELLKGAAYLFSREPRSLDVRTPYVNAAVEGTEFLVRVEPERTFISVFEGRVLAANPQGQLSLGSRQSASAPANQPPQRVTVVRPRDAVQWTLYYQPVLAALLEPAAKPPQRLQGIGSSWDDRAIPRLFDLLEQTPPAERDQNFYVFRAGLWLTVGQVGPARSDLDQALKLTPDYSPALALLAMMAVTQNNQDPALKLANQAVQQDPNSAAARIALSYAQQAQFDLNGALASLQQAVQINPRNALAQARLAELWLSLGFLNNALAAAQQAVTLNPNLARTQTVLGFADLTQIKIREAQRAFTRAIELDQADPLPRLGLGLAKIRRGKLQDGRSDIEIAVSLNPDNSLLRSYMGKAYYEEKRNPLAASQYDMAKQFDPLDPTPWLYDAFLKQTTNRPVAALRDLEQSIERNNNRAVFRSKFFLDQDLAVRNASLGNIYRSLGFEQAALVQGWRSVESSPANYSAHRLLADSYSVLPRHEIARDSELLQSQLLQPINTNPVFPLLGRDRSELLYDTNIPAIGYNEYSLLFVSNQTRLRLDGSAGNHDTLADNVTLYGIHDRLSYSLSQFHLESNGIRENNDMNLNFYNAFVQATLSDQTSVQLQAQSWEKNTGYPYLLFFPDNLSATQRNDFDNYFVRLGLRHDFTPYSTLIASYVYRDFNDDVEDPGFARVSTDEGGQLFELRHLYQHNWFSITGGLGYLDSGGNVSVTFEPAPPFTSDTVTRDANGYLYSYLNPTENLTFILGASFDSIKNLDIEKSQFNPKMGFTWSFLPNTTLRATAFRTLKRPFIINQTIEPTNVAGFNQFFDNPNGTYAWRYGVGLDQKAFRDWLWGAEFSKRDLQVPGYVITNPEQVVYEGEQEQLGRAYVYWTPAEDVALSGEYQFQQFDRNPLRNPDQLAESQTHLFPLGLRLFLPSGPFFGISAIYAHQDGQFLDATGALADGTDSFWTFNAFLGYRLPKRFGVIYTSVANLFDNEFQFQDTDPTNPQIVPERFIQAGFSVTF